jgi:hypothetical protein
VFWTRHEDAWRPYGRDLAWVADLVHPDPARRDAARERFGRAEENYGTVQRGINAVLAQAGGTRPVEPRLGARMDQLLAEQREAAAQSLLHTLWQGWATWRASAEWFRGDQAELVHYSLWYLEWEALYPAEWHKHWGTKSGLLRGMATCTDLDDDQRRRLLDLIVLAVRREHRCEDKGYVGVARAVQDAELRGRIRAETSGRDSVAQLRAAFLLYLLDRPATPATPASWRRWLATSS